MAEILGDNERRDLYRKMLNDAATAESTKKYSFKDFEKKLLGDEQLIGKISDLSVKRGWSIDKDDFFKRYTPELTQTSAPKAAPVQQFVEAPVEEDAYIPEPPPAVGTPEYDAELQRQYGGMAPTLGATFGGAPASFETKEQKKQEQISPAFKAQQLAFEDVPIASEQRRAQKQFAKATKEQQKAAIMGGTGFELSQSVADENRAATQKLKDFGYSIGALFDNVIDKTKAAEAMFGAKQRSLLTFGEQGKKAEEQEKKVKQGVVDYIDKLDQEFAAKQADYNINGDLFDVISKGQLDRIPEAFAYNLAQIGVQALAASRTGGYSMFAQVLPDLYKSGVEEIAKKTKTTPEQVIASGNDKELLSYLGSTLSGYIENLSGGILGKAMKSKGAYKFIRDKALDKIGKTKWKQAAASGIALAGTAGLEGATEGAQGLVEVVTPQIAPAKSFQEARENIYGELQKPSTQKRLAGEIVGGAAGGGGLVVGGRALDRILEGDYGYGDVLKAPATQRPDVDIIQTDNKIQERNKIRQAMESAVESNPEAEGQIRQQYQKRIDAAAPTNEEVLTAYESTAQLPESEEKAKIQQNLEAYMAEKGIQPEAVGQEAGLGELMRREAPEAPVAEEVVDDDEYANFIDNGIVSEERLNDIAEKVRNREELTERENAIFADKAGEVNAIIEGRSVEVTPEAGMFAGIEGPTEEAPATSGLFEGITGPPQEAPVAAEEVPVAVEEVVAAEEVPAPAPKGRKKQPAAPKPAPVTPPAAPKAQPVAEKKEEKPAPKAEPKGKKYPIEDKGKWYADEDYQKRGGELVSMTPDEFLAQSKELVIDEEARDNIDSLKEHIQKGGKLDPLAIYSTDKTKSSSTDGRHRAIAAKELGIKEVPVLNFAKAEAKPTTGVPQEGSKVNLPPQSKYSTGPRKMVFKDGQWKEEVGGEFTSVGEAVQKQAQEAFLGKMETKPVAEAKGSAKESLAKRLKGDALLDAEDTLAELSDNGATINPDGTVVVYHRTSKYKADDIVKNNEMFGLEDGVFFSTSEKGQAEGYGDVVVKMNVPIEQIQIDDTFGNEAHVRIPTKKANQKISVAKFSPQLTKAEETKPAPKAPETKPAETKPAELALLPKELLGETTIGSTGFGGDREYTVGKANLKDLKVLDVGIETAKQTFENNKSFKPSKDPIVVGVDIITGEKQLLDGYHRYLAKNGEGEVSAKFIPMKDGEIISFEEAKSNTSPSVTQTEFTSKQEGNASTEFDGIKKPSKIKTKSFDNKYGKGAFERMQNITQNFEDIMDGLSEKIKQDCL